MGGTDVIAPGLVTLVINPLHMCWQLHLQLQVDSATGRLHFCLILVVHMHEQHAR
jgi:hypothetical protein